MRPSEYNQRDVLTLKSLGEWSEAEKATHLKHNIILQPGFSNREDPESMINDANMIGEEWLTSICCPSTTSALFLHLAREMVVTYKVGENDLNEKAQSAYALLMNDPDIVNVLKERIQSRINKSEDEIGALARVRLSNNKKSTPLERLDAAKRIERDLERKSATYAVIEEYITTKRDF